MDKILMRSVLFFALVATFVSCKPDNALVSSPDGRLVYSVNGNSYSVTKDGEAVLDESLLGFVTDRYGNLADGAKVVKVEKYSNDQTWEQVWGQSHYVRDCHNGMKITFRNAEGVGFVVNVRVFNDGFGFRYEFPEAMGKFDILEENTTFNFSKAHSAWWMSRSVPYYEGYAEHTAFTQIDTAYTPFTVTGSDGRFYAIHEAALLDFSKMNLAPENDRCLRSVLTSGADGIKVHVDATRVSPWRTVTVSDDAAGLIESNIMLNLNEPCKIEDTSWIKPGKYVGIWWIMHKYLYNWYYDPLHPQEHAATTERTKRYIDFAASHNIQAVLVEGWNEGWNGDWMKNSDAINFTRAYPDYDFDEVMAYARSKGVQMVIHNETAANTVNYFRQIDSAYTKYSNAGMHYIKTGNVNLLIDGIEEHDSQYGVNRLHEIVEKAAQYKICVDEHEPCIPTGLGRTWPNLMTHEAIRGQEHDAWETDGGNRPEHQTIMPFVRGLAGPMDYTFGTFDFSNPVSPFSRVRTTIAKQLAQYVVIYSPLQMASDDPYAYEGVKAFDFIRDVATDWEQTKVLDAVIGDYVVTARQVRDGSDWFLGAITDENARELSVSLSFLGDGEWLAQIYADAADASYEDNPTAVDYSERIVSSSDTLDMHLATSGGCAVRFIKK